MPIFYKVLIANIGIVVVGALVGTWITIQTVRHAPNDRFAVLATSFALAGLALSLVVNFLVLRAAFRPLSTLQQAATAVRGGDLDARAQATSLGDPQIEELAATLNEILDELALDRVQLRSLATQVIRAQEDERRRIARELHDDTAQVLFAQLLRLNMLKASDDPSVVEMASTLQHMTSEALEGVRRLALELRPPALDDLGLLAALADLAQRFSEQLGIRIDQQSRGPRGRMPPDIELVLYRVAQEALINIAKHGGASAAWVDLDRTDHDVVLSVRDNGRGFDPAVAAASDGRGLGLGIFGMEERVTLMNGEFSIWSRANEGTEVFAFIPLRNLEGG